MSGYFDMTVTLDDDTEAEIEIKWTQHGWYRPATREEPAEYPEVEIEAFLDGQPYELNRYLQELAEELALDEVQ